MNKSMTAVVSAFARAYHSENCDVHIFNDILAKKLLSEREYNEVAGSMKAGRTFFLPGFIGTDEEALAKIVERQLAPSPLGRAAFTENALSEAVSSGTEQYLILAAGYDTFAYRMGDEYSQLRVFEVDLPATAEDKQRRLKNAGISVPESVRYIHADLTDPQWCRELSSCEAFRPSETSFCSLLGLVYYITHNAFRSLTEQLSAVLAPGSTLVFDFPVRDKASDTVKKQTQLAAAAGEGMSEGYSETEIRELIEGCGFSVKQLLSPDEITQIFFSKYNDAYPSDEIKAFDGVDYCLAVKG